MRKWVNTELCAQIQKGTQLSYVIFIQHLRIFETALSLLIYQMYVDQIGDFLRAGTPVDAVGAQCHFDKRPQGPIILRRLNRLASAGLPIWVTELDYADSDDSKLADGLEDALLAFFRLVPYRPKD